MIEITPQVYSEFQRDIYIQRYRESWSSHLEFLKARGWRQIARAPLIGKATLATEIPPADLRSGSRDDLSFLSELSQLDEMTASPLSLEVIQNRFDAGWIVHETFWCLGDRGAFVLEPRGDQAAVTVLYARPESWERTVVAALAQATRLGASEAYFTLEAKDERKQRALEAMGFSEVDAGVYYVCDAN